MRKLWCVLMMTEHLLSPEGAPKTTSRADWLGRLLLTKSLPRVGGCAVRCSFEESGPRRVSMTRDVARRGVASRAVSVGQARVPVRRGRGVDRTGQDSGAESVVR